MLTEENKLGTEEIDNAINQPLINEVPSQDAPFNLTENPVEDSSQRLLAELSEQKDKYLRLYAEFDNFKRRTSKERVDLIKTAGQEIIVELINVLDDFERAQKIAVETGNKSAYTEGLSLIHNKLLGLLISKGLKPMLTENMVFDPEQHEAIVEIPTPAENMKGKIIETVEKGYLLSDKIIRFAKVVVGK